MARRPIHRLQVSEKRALTPHMSRVTLRGPSLAEFPDGTEGGYVKLLLPREAGIDVAELDPQTVDPAPFIKRSFTVRAFDRKAQSMTLDFVSTGHAGAASSWLLGCAVGDPVLITGPGPVKSLVPEADWVLLAADMSALPALFVQLERLPRDARGAAVIEVLHDDDRQTVDAPPGVEVHWVVTPDVRVSQLARAVRERTWAPGRVSFWAACEFSSMKQLRSYLFEERGVPRADGYISSYWKLDATDEQHKAAKRVEAMAAS